MSENPNKYQLQSRRYDDPWKDDDEWGYPKDQSDLPRWIEIAEGADDFEGRYEYRIVDQSGKFVWGALAPYEGVRINLAAPAHEWLDEIRSDYGLDVDVFESACRAWITEKAGEAFYATSE